MQRMRSLVKRRPLPTVQKATSLAAAIARRATYQGQATAVAVRSRFFEEKHASSNKEKKRKENNYTRATAMLAATGGLLTCLALFDQAKEENPKAKILTDKLNFFEKILNIPTVLGLPIKDRLDKIESVLANLEKSKAVLDAQLKIPTSLSGTENTLQKNASFVERIDFLERKIKNIGSIPNYCYEQGEIEIKTTDCEISFTNSEKGLAVMIKTPRLILRSITENDCDHYYRLYSDPDVMKTFHDGKPKSQELVKARYVDHWINDWKTRSIFGAFAIFERDNGVFVGNIAPDHRGDDPGEAELAYLVTPKQWGKGYGNEAANAVVNNYIPLTLLIGSDSIIRDQAVINVVATSRLDNVGSKKILGKYMSPISSEAIEKYGALRQTYKVSREELVLRMLFKQPKISKFSARISQGKCLDNQHAVGQ